MAPSDKTVAPKAACGEIDPVGGKCRCWWMITAFLPLRVFSPEDFNFANRAATELRKQHSLWRAVERDGEVVDVFLQARRGGKAAMRFFK